MEKYLVPQKPSPQPSKPIHHHHQRRGRYGWERSLIEVTGRSSSKYRHHLSPLLLHSYSQMGAFPHKYHAGGDNSSWCQTHLHNLSLDSIPTGQIPLIKQGIAGLEFDNQGVYLVSVTKSGCLTVHDFESLYCQATESLPLGLAEDESKHVLHLSLRGELDAVCWNPANQNEVACSSMKSSEVQIYDISYVSSEPVQLLKSRRRVTVHGSDIHKGLTDIVCTSTQSWLIASDLNGGVNLWDRRTGALPCLEFATNSPAALYSIQLTADNHMVLGAGRYGRVSLWDLRGGRAAAFQIHKEVCHQPVGMWNLSSLLEQIDSLKAQSEIVSKDVHAIVFDPSCPYQLAFHLDDGWSGVLDVYNSEVTHVHCPPPAWLNSNTATSLMYLRKPSWLPTNSVYVVGSSAEDGIYLLDFYPDPSSPCHVQYCEDVEKHSGSSIRKKHNRFVPLSEGVTACATHPLNGAIIAGTKESSLLLVSQQKNSDL
ncbi:hypothetical protein Tsubulata_006979 [Turnera subulata]|uniref:Transducin/WD40 repeat-like superfamily protein n=1 Tax=Turnera subulata TaxID=218843 RepID=A0A9Q0GDG9_9ROSI|nr:hypothetical protein Tsubulata_006979 [Turnera subulata]